MVRFIILAHARSGSSLLMLALRQHQHILMSGEIFHQTGDFWVNYRRLNGAGPTRLNGAMFLRSCIFHERQPEQSLAVGFKILYGQARSDIEKSAWTYLQETESIRIIHVSRTNLLESWASLQIALSTGQWFLPRGASSMKQPPQIQLDPAAAKQYFEQISSYRQRVAHIFSKHRLLELDYDLDLCSRLDETLSSIQQFLEVPFQRLQPVLEKQAQFSPADQIVNYGELKAYFENTPYFTFFEP